MEQQKKMLHSELKVKLMEVIFPKNHTYDQFLTFLKVYLSPIEVSEAKSDITTAFDSLEAKGHLAEGKYDVLKTILRDIHVPAVKIIEDYERKFENLETKDIEADTSNASDFTAAANDGVCRSLNTCQFVCFDVVASLLSRDARGLGIEIGLESSEIDNIEEEYPGLTQEQNFQMLWKWYRNNNKCNHLEILNKVLIKIGRNDIVKRLSEFKMENFDYQCSFKGNEKATDKDFLIVSAGISREVYKLLRFLNLEQPKIDEIRMNHINNHKEQNIKMFNAWRSKTYPNCTRDKLCSGLKYVEREDIITSLETSWSKSSN